MKKRILLSLLLLATTFAFAKDLFSDLMKKFESTNLFYFIDSYNKYPSKEELGDKIPLRFWNESKEEFTRLTRNGMDYERFPNVENVTFENIKGLLKANDNFFAYSSDSYIDFKWHEGKKNRIR